MKKGLITLVVGASCLLGITNLSSGEEIFSHFNRATNDIEYKVENSPFASLFGTSISGVDYWQTPKETAEKGTGDEEDKAFYLCDGLVKDGYKAEVVFGLLMLGTKEIYSWVEMNLDGDEYILDPRVGLIQRRSHLAGNNSGLIYVPILGKEHIKKQYDEFMERAGLDYEPCRHYSDDFYNSMKLDENNLKGQEIGGQEK